MNSVVKTLTKIREALEGQGITATSIVCNVAGIIGGFIFMLIIWVLAMATIFLGFMAIAYLASYGGDMGYPHAAMFVSLLFSLGLCVGVPLLVRKFIPKNKEGIK